MEQYSRGWRGAPAKGVGRVTGAKVQILSSPPEKSTVKTVLFSYPSHRLGISSTHEVRCISSAPVGLYIITRQRVFPCGLMIYNGKPLVIYRNKLRMIYTPPAWWRCERQWRFISRQAHASVPLFLRRLIVVDKIVNILSQFKPLNRIYNLSLIRNIYA